MGFVMCLGVFAGLDAGVWRVLRPVSLALAYGSMMCGAYYTAHFGLMGSFEGVNPMVEHLQIALWLALSAVLLTQPGRWLQFAAALVPIMACIPMAIVISSRSFALLSSLAFAYGLLFALRARVRLSLLSLVAVICFTAVVAGAILLLLSVTAPDRVLALKERLFQDSRTSQYAQFFRQVPVAGLILGLGPKATYTYNQRANYEYIDNQFLYILFKLGFPVLLGYCAVVLWPGFRLLIKAANQPQRMEGGVFILWTLASLGLSIFHGILPNPSNFLIILLAGRAFALEQVASTTASPVHWKASRGQRGAILRAEASVGIGPGGSILVPPERPSAASQ
jgi:hypothetical protein